MLTDTERTLILLAVDGELSPAQEAAFRRLIESNAAARTLHQRLLAQRTGLQRLPRTKAPANLASTVMARIQTLPVTIPATPTSTPTFPRWVPAAIAASLFFGVTWSSFWVARSWDSPNTATIQLAQKQSLPRPTPGPDGRDIPTTVAVAPDRKPEPLDIRPRHVDPNPTVIVQNSPNPTTPEAIVSPRPVVGELVGAALLNEPKPLTNVEVRLPLLLSVAELDQPHAQTRLKAELARDAAFRLDLFVQDPIKAVEVFQAAAKVAGVTVSTDALAADRMRRKLPSAWAIFTESLTAEDVAKLVAELSLQDRMAPKPLFDLAHLIPAKTTEQRELRDLLGIDPGLWKRPTAAPDLSGKPISSGTVDQVTAALTKGKTPEKPALLLTHWPVAGRVNPMMSKEIRDFLARRADRKPGEIPLFIVIRPNPN